MHAFRASFMHMLLNFLQLVSRLLPASYATITIPTSWLPTGWPGEESVLWFPAAPCAEDYSAALAACPAALAACPCTSSCACLFEALAACPCAKEYSPALAACPEAMAACPCAEEYSPAGQPRRMMASMISARPRLIKLESGTTYPAR